MRRVDSALAAAPLALLLAAALLAGVPSRAQDAPRGPQPATEPAAPAAAIEERVEVTLHLIDVVAVDRDGKALRDLQKSNFEVRIDGEPRAIATLDAAAGPPQAQAGAAPTTGQPAPGARPARPPAPEQGAAARWTVLLFDADRITPEDRERALATARGIVRTQAGPGDRYAVAVLRSGNLEYTHTFAPAGEQVDAQLANPDQILGRLPSFSRRLDEMVEGISNCRDSKSQVDCALSTTTEFVTLLRAETKDALSALRDLVAALAPLPGRKALVLFTDGLVLQPGQVALTAINRLSDSAGSFASSRLADPTPWDYETLISEASRARVSVFTVRTGPNLALGLSDASSRWATSDRDRMAYNPYMVAAQQIETDLRRVAEGTGGRAIPNPTDSGRIPPLITQLDGVYTLGVPFQRGDSIKSKISVKLAGVAGRLVAPSRLAYRGRLPAPVAGRVVHAGGTDVRLELEPMHLSVWRESDTPQGESRVALYYRVVDQAGAVQFEDYVVLAFPRFSGKGEPLVHPLRLPVGPGTYVVTATVSDLVGRGRGTIEQVVTVPGTQGS